jgi:dihydroorotate dehydrogenase electron transfer subunit
MVKCGEETILRRPLSIHSVDMKSGAIELLFTPVGKGTEWLANQDIGTQIDLLGPLGNGFSVKRGDGHILIVAGGIGIAPMKFLATAAIESGHRVIFLLGAKTAKGLYPSDKLPAGIELIRITDDGSCGQRGVVTTLIAAYIRNIDQVFVCGPRAMYEEISRQQNKHKWPQEIQVSLEARMGCGFGACYGCSILTKQGMKRICRDGPVFNIKDIIWQEVKL